MEVKRRVEDSRNRAEEEALRQTNSDLPHVMGDRVQLQQVLMNLMMNSIDAMRNADGTRELTINSQLGENEPLVVSVSDTGVGIPPQRAD